LGNTGVIIQVRTGSTRLAGKMILPFYEGQPMIELILDRFDSELSNSIPLIIATTDNPLDDAIENIARKKKINLYRGSENDVLMRFIRASEKFNLQNIIRICADNPLFDVKGTFELTSYIKSGNWDYIGYKIKGNRPTILTHSGFWGEVVTLSALKKAHKETSESFYREHVTNYIYERPEKFSVKLVDAPDYLFYRDDIRLTVDTTEDFEMMKELYSRLIEENIRPEPVNIISYIDDHPEYLTRMNRQIELNRKV
jgi:spore coat polysaccharide biosynthesis protein SpsF (cytidylyltransferase family)